MDFTDRIETLLVQNFGEVSFAEDGTFNFYTDAESISVVLMTNLNVSMMEDQKFRAYSIY